ncbi:MAG: flagellar basal body rod protein FlgC [Candidatus Marinimicrobia bacterium]|nr:flagellar basal body rod protein FlgC [Candidatus Neomarinimicrobiota bacterium]MCF7880494.1 flagellar basal body rod protein FlgC [Candidatus Neomarinimicrobiota bacterium]
MKLNSLFRGIDISATALRAHRRGMEIVSENIANVNTTRTKDGTPYQKQTPIYTELDATSFKAVMADTVSRVVGTRSGHIRGSNTGSLPSEEGTDGVEVTALRPADQEYRLVYEPSHPDADQQGYVRFPKINILEEMVQLMNISRSFEASVTAMNAAKEMSQKALEI